MKNLCVQNEAGAPHIGLLFGSYNPPHLAHVEKAEKMKKTCGLSEVWMMPVPQSPYKKDIDQVPFEGKVEMCRIVAEPHQDWLKVNKSCANFPATMTGQLQQYKRTIEGLFNEHSGAKFSIVAGEDFSKKYREVAAMMGYLGMMSEAYKEMSIFQFKILEVFADRMIRANDVFRRLDVLSSERETLQIDDGVVAGISPHVEISSSALRSAIRAGAENIHGLPAKLHDYILQKGFYKAPQLQHD